MDKKEIKFNIPLRLYQRINRVSESLGYNDVEEFNSYYMSLNFQAFDTPEEQHYEGWCKGSTRDFESFSLGSIPSPSAMPGRSDVGCCWHSYKVLIPGSIPGTRTI